MRNKKDFLARLFLLIVFICSFVPAWAGGDKGLKVYITRHAETMGNVTGNYSEENQRRFSPKGLTQIEHISDKLKDYRFDYVFVSPMYRTQYTILPYLKSHNITAEIWPEIDEKCFDITSSTVPSKTIPEDGLIELFDEKYFKLRDASSTRMYDPRNASEGLAQFLKARDMIERYSGSGKSMLLVCHYCTGSRLIEILLELEPRGRFGPKNCAVSLLEQKPDGTFRMLQYNDMPFIQKFFWKQDDAAGEYVTLHLFPDMFLNDLNEKFDMSWKVYDNTGALVKEGKSAFSSKKRDGKPLVDIRIPAGNIKEGSVCSIETSVSGGGKEVYSWKDRFLIPTYKSLEGNWIIKKGDNPERAEEDYQENKWIPVHVPEPWEKNALPGYDGIAWYRCRFAITEEDLKKWEGKKIVLLMGAIDDADVTYLNGSEIGKTGSFPPHESTAWDKPRVYLIDRNMLKDNNVLAVRVCDWTGGGGIWAGPVVIGPSDEINALINQKR
ncbi:MAG: histidine phosphatase family protein [Candidatus Aureabacteria bacterium]|nr:histidine phosphatase family protein [Candidatus Auribacterota bacterium]